MEKLVKNILEKIENEGYEAYLVGGYVRDALLGKESYDIDICTNALPKNLHEIFINAVFNNYGGLNLKIKKYNIDITTYRKEIKYENRKPIEIEYINNLLEDLKRRDFTINSICMNKKGEIIDLLNGIKDLDQRVIKLIEKEDKLKEDPLRMLRAIRFATILDFNLDEKLKKEIKENSIYLQTISKEKIKEELSKILLSKNYQKGLDLIKELDLIKYIYIDYDKIIYVNNILLMYAQMKKNELPFTKYENEQIAKMKQIIDYGTIDETIIFKYDLYLSICMGEYFNISKKEINKKYKNLPIKNEGELAINSKDIMNTLNITPSKEVGIIKDEIINLVINKKLINNKKTIINYLKKNYSCGVKYE